MTRDNCPVPDIPNKPGSFDAGTFQPNVPACAPLTMRPFAVVARSNTVVSVADLRSIELKLMPVRSSGGGNIVICNPFTVCVVELLSVMVVVPTPPGAIIVPGGKPNPVTAIPGTRPAVDRIPLIVKDPVVMLPVIKIGVEIKLGVPMKN